MLPMPLQGSKTEKVTKGKICNWRSVEAKQTLEKDGAMSAWHWHREDSLGVHISLQKHVWCQKREAAFSAILKSFNTGQNDWFWACCYHVSENDCKVHWYFPPYARALGSSENDVSRSVCVWDELPTLWKINYATELDTSFWKLHYTYELDTCCSRKICHNGCWLHRYFPSVGEKFFYCLESSLE